MQTKLGRWMKDNRFSNKRFSEKIAAEMGVAEFSPRTVEAWRYGKSVPRAAAMRAVFVVTCGEITANDFVFEEGDG